MKVEEESAQLLDELRQLREQVADLKARVRALEAEAPEQLPEPEERDGDFGPAVKRSTSNRHQSAVNKALTMLGVFPAQAEPEPQKTKQLSASHQRALARMKAMGDGDGDAAKSVESKSVNDAVAKAKAMNGDQPEPEPKPKPQAAPAPAVEPAVTIEATDEIGEVEAPVVVADPDEIIPLPEVRDEARPANEAHHDPTPVALETALSIDLEHPASRVPDLLRLLLETVAVSVLLVGLPVHQGVLAATGFVALLALPNRRVLRAHARFLSLIVLARCLFPEVWAVASPLQLSAMLAACLPPFAVVFVGRVGWAVQAVGMSAVAAAIALSQGAASLSAAGTGVVVLGLTILWRRAGR